VAAVCLAALSFLAAEEPNLTEEQTKEFLLKAKIIRSKNTPKGVTSPWRLSLSDGVLTHDGAFQSIDERKMRMELQGGKTEFNFRDSYHFNIAAYELAKLLGIGHMVPVSVERRWQGTLGSLSWWVPSKMDEAMRKKDNIQPPDPNAWNKQLNKMWVFSELIYNTDRNQTNILITEDWKLWMIDFSRAFRLSRDLLEPGHLIMCDRQLLEALRRLNEADVLGKTKPHLGKDEVRALMARRDKIVQLFEKMVVQKGEGAVLY
jgi:hypothetical protein